MDPHELEALLRLELAANRTLDWLMHRIFTEQTPDEAIETLKGIANQMPPHEDHPLAAMGYYRGMREMLSEEDFRWPGCDMVERSTEGVRRDRLRVYRRYRELFEMEIALVRRQRRGRMALARDWSHLQSYAREDMIIWRYRLMLRFAGTLFRMRVPGALDFCDEAVFRILRTLYFVPVA